MCIQEKPFPKLQVLYMASCSINTLEGTVYYHYNTVINTQNTLIKQSQKFHDWIKIYMFKPDTSINQLIME